jgi:hypothetical protein
VLYSPKLLKETNTLHKQRTRDDAETAPHGVVRNVSALLYLQTSLYNCKGAYTSAPQGVSSLAEPVLSRCFRPVKGPSALRFFKVRCRFQPATERIVSPRFGGVKGLAKVFLVFRFWRLCAWLVNRRFFVRVSACGLITDPTR